MKTTSTKTVGRFELMSFNDRQILLLQQKIELCKNNQRLEQITIDSAEEQIKCLQKTKQS